MIYGIGTDIIEISRVLALYDSYGSRFVAKILHPSEIIKLESLTQSKKIKFVAKRWVAKEALVKALGTGLRAPFYMSNISVASDSLGKPCFQFGDRLQQEIHSLAGFAVIHLTISDENNYAVAMVIVEN